MNNPFSNIVLGWIWRRSGQELSSDHPWALATTGVVYAACMFC